MEGITPKEVDRMLQQHLRQRSDLGLWNASVAKIFEPHNPFESGSSRRKPQRWFVLFVVSSVAAAAALAYFNFWN
jgi:hypothetical protein